MGRGGGGEPWARGETTRRRPEKKAEEKKEEDVGWGPRWEDAGAAGPSHHRPRGAMCHMCGKLHEMMSEILRYMGEIVAEYGG